MFTENLAAFLADFGVPAVWKTNPAQMVIFDQPDAEVLSGRVSSRNYKMTYLTSAFAGIAYKDPVTIGGITYKVLEMDSIDDGVFSSAALST